MEMPAARGVAAWHRAVRNMGPEALDEVLAKDVVFHSPVVHTPQEGLAITKLYLLAAFNVFPGDDSPEAGGPAAKTSEEGGFRYVREVVGERDAILEFETSMGGIFVNGVDMMKFDDAGKIVEFKVMIRPLKAIQKVHANMAAMLENLKK